MDLTFTHFSSTTSNTEKEYCIHRMLQNEHNLTSSSTEFSISLSSYRDDLTFVKQPPYLTFIDQ